MSENEAVDLRHLIIDEADEAVITILEDRFIDGDRDTAPVSDLIVINGAQLFAERVMSAYDGATEWNGNGFSLNAPKFRRLVAALYERELGGCGAAIVEEGPDAPGTVCFELDGRRYIIHEITAPHGAAPHEGAEAAGDGE